MQGLDATRSLIVRAIAWGLAITVMMALAGGKKKIEADFTVKGWVNINRHLSYNVAHSHPDCHWSGVYYAATGEPDPKYPMSGVIEFRDPRGAT